MEAPRWGCRPRRVWLFGAPFTLLHVRAIAALRAMLQGLQSGGRTTRLPNDDEEKSMFWNTRRFWRGAFLGAVVPLAATGCHRGHHDGSESEMREHAHDVAELVLEHVDASTEQEARIEQIIDPLVPESRGPASRATSARGRAARGAGGPRDRPRQGRSRSVRRRSRSRIAPARARLRAWSMRRRCWTRDSAPSSSDTGSGDTGPEPPHWGGGGHEHGAGNPCGFVVRSPPA